MPDVYYERVCVCVRTKAAYPRVFLLEVNKYVTLGKKLFSNPSPSNILFNHLNHVFIESKWRRHI